MSTSVADFRPTSSTVLETSRGRAVALQTGLLLAAVFGTNAGVPGVIRWVDDAPLVTTTPVNDRTRAFLSIANEVRELRDEICTYGLTRQEVARAVGVDRRSLSGWVSGEIRPSADRLHVLRLLGRLVADIATERPDHVRDVLLVRRSGTALIDRVVVNGATLLRTWRATARPDATVALRAAPGQFREPIWAPAEAALAEGRLTPPTWERTMRPDTAYEMDVDEAGAFHEPEPHPRRRGYR